MKHAKPQEATASPRIGTIDSLREHVQWAIELEQAFDGNPGQLVDATRTMFTLRAKAQALMGMPDGEGTTAGPTFAHVPSPERDHPWTTR